MYRLSGQFLLSDNTHGSVWLAGRSEHARYVTNFLSEYNFSSEDLWEFVNSDVRAVASDNAVVLFDDTIPEKPHTDENEVVCWAL